jgi:hypothetical protein
MLRTRIARIVAGVAVASLALVGLVVAPAQAVTTYTISGHVDLGTIGSSATADEVTVSARLTNSGTASATSKTDEFGNYQLAVPHGPYIIEFRYSGSGAFSDFAWRNALLDGSGTTLNVNSDVADISIVLPSPKKLSGRIYLGESGLPAGAGEAEVRYATRVGNVWVPSDPVMTDANGRYTFLDLPSASYRVLVDYLPSAAFKDDTFSASVVGADVTNANFVLKPEVAPTEVPGEISGSVWLGDPDTRASGDVNVLFTEVGKVHRAQDFVTVDARGSYKISGLTGVEYYVFFDYTGDAGFYDEWYTSPGVFKWSSSPEDVAHKIQPGKWGSHQIIAVLQTEWTIRGTVWLGSQDTLAGAGAVSVGYECRREFYGGWTPGTSTVLTQADGSFELTDIPPASYCRVVLDDAVGSTYQRLVSDSVSLWNGIYWTNTLIMRAKKTFSGTVMLGTSPAGVGEVQVGAVDTSGNPVGGPPVETDESGHYTIAGIESSWRLKFTYAGEGEFVRTITKDLPVGNVIDVTFTAGFEVAGRIYVDSTSRVATAGEFKVTLRSPYPAVALATAVTDSDGRYRLVGIEPRGGLYLQIEQVGREVPDWFVSYLDEPGSKEGPSIPGIRIDHSIQNYDIVVGTGPAIEGTLVDSAKHPLSGTDVRLFTVDDYYDDELVDTTVTLASGKFKFRDVRQGVEYRVEWGGSDSGYARQRWGAANVIGEGKPVVVKTLTTKTGINGTLYRPANIAGHVTATGYVTTDYSAASDLRIEMLRYDSSTKKWVGGRPYYRVDDAGNYSIDGLIPGDYRVHVIFEGWAADGTTTSATIKIGEGANVAWSGSVIARPWLVDRDYDSDDYADVVYIEPSGAMSFVSTGGEFTHEDPVAVSGNWLGMTVAAASDFDSDTTADLFVRHADGSLWLAQGDGAGGFGEPVNLSVNLSGATSILGPGDFSGDGRNDLIYRSSDGTLYLLRGNGVGGFSGAKVKIASGWKSRLSIIAGGDFSGDGMTDIVSRDSSGVMWLYPGNGKSGFKSRIKLATGWKWKSTVFSVGDVVGNDNCPDILAREKDGTINSYQGNCKSKIRGHQSWSSGWKGLTIVN